MLSKFEKFIQQASGNDLVRLKREITEDLIMTEKEIAELELAISHLRDKISVLVREKKILGHQIASINDAMRRFESEETRQKKERSDKFERLFIEIAKQKLPDSLFSEIKEAAASEIRKTIKLKVDEKQQKRD